jgi:hypothetical protein
MVRSDNVITRALVNKQGSRQHAHLHQLATRLLYLCSTHQIKLFARCIPGRENHVADHLSRQILHPEHEVPLSTDQFVALESMFGERKLDVFASSANSQVKQYFSLNPERHAVGTDALQHPWPAKAYAHPPWLLINRMLA